MYKILGIGLLGIQLAAMATCTAQVGDKPLHFEKYKLCDSFVSEGAAVADIDGDGQRDIIAGAYWFKAPEWQAHEYAVPQRFEYDKGYSNAFLHFAMDVDQDGRTDIIRVGFPGKEVVWYKNPVVLGNHWEEQVIHEAFGNETPMLIDMNDDGRPDLVGNDPTAEEVIWLESPSRVGDTKWIKHVISNQPGLGTHQFTHGVGVGDLNGDGRMDVLNIKGWWEGPEIGSEALWTFHPSNFGEDCAQMYLFDVNDDGLLDVISSSAHNYGVWWYEQQKDGAGGMVWAKHIIDDSFSQSHALMLKDLDGDGQADLITGKRFFAHNGGDPGAFEPAVLRWYQHTSATASYWVMHQVDDDSGVGLNFAVEDVNGDGLEDIVVSNKKGVHYFEQVD